MIILIGVLLGGCNVDDKAETIKVEKPIIEEVEETEVEVEEEAKSMYTVDSYLKSVESNLETHSDSLIEKLKELQTYHFSSDVEILDFNAERTDFDLSIRMFSMDKAANEVFYEGNDSEIFAGSLDIIENLRYTIVLGNETDDFYNFYDQNIEELDPAEQKLIAKWFSECWKQANGQAIELPAYFAFHDEYESFDLKKDKWVSDDEKWTE